MSGTIHARRNNYNPVLVKYMSRRLGLAGGPEHPISSFLSIVCAPGLSSASSTLSFSVTGVGGATHGCERSHRDIIIQLHLTSRHRPREALAIWDP